MKILNKNDYAFASGMFWQIADEGKRSPNFTKLAKDTRHDLYCHIKSPRPTWGFCRRDELHGVKQAAALGKYIITTSDLLSATDNIIVTYKFKSAGELDENDQALTEDLYGYIILLDGTICPDEGEYVSNFESVKESIVHQANRYKIQCLYLTVDVAIKFFNIYQLLIDYQNSQMLLEKLLANMSEDQLLSIQNLGFDLNNIDDSKQLNEFMQSEVFQKEYKRTRDIEIPFLFEYIQITPYLSDEIYWDDARIKQYYKPCLLQSLKRQSNSKVKLIFVMLLFVTLAYLIYSVLIKEDEQIAFVAPPPEVPIVMPVNPITLIEKCIITNDRYFLDLESWILKSLKCDSLSTTLTFEANTNLTFNDFEHLIGESKGITFNNHLGDYKTKYWIKNKMVINRQPISHGQILTNLEEASTQYSFTLQLQNGVNAQMQGFTINSNVSPLFLLKHHVFDDVLIKDIQMTLNQSSGLYTWIITGEFRK